MSAKNKTFTVQVDLSEVCVSFEVSAPTIEEALKIAQGLNTKKTILQPDLDWIDGEMKVTGLFS